jgi:hypothetical protein
VVGYTSGHTFYIDLKAVLPGQINRLAKAIDQVQDATGCGWNGRSY